MPNAHVSLLFSSSAPLTMADSDECGPTNLLNKPYKKKKGTCPICLVPTTKEKRAELPCGHVFCRSCVKAWANHLVFHSKTEITCTECGIRYQSFWTFKGKKSVFNPDEGFIPVPQFQVPFPLPKPSKSARRRQRLIERLRVAERLVEVLQNPPAPEEPIQGVIP